MHGITCASGPRSSSDHWSQFPAPPAELEPRHKREKLETQLAKRRDAMEKRHAKELAYARADDAKAAKR